MAFYIQNIRQTQVFTKALGQRFLSLKALPTCRRILKSTKPSFIQWNSSLELSGRTCVPSTSNFHHLAVLSVRSGAHLKRTKPSCIKWKNSLELSGRTYVPSTCHFHHLAENTLNSNAAYFMKLGAFILKPTETNNATLERMGIKIHCVNVTEKIKETGFVKNVPTVTETEGTR